MSELGKEGGENKIIHPVPQGLRSGFGEPFMKGITECGGGSGARSGARRRPLLPVASRRRCRRHLGAAPQLCPTTAWGGAEEGKSAGGGGGAGERTPSCTERGSEMVTLAVGVMKVLSGRLQRGQKYVGGESWLERQVN